MEYSNEDYVKQFLILLGYVMIFCFIYQLKYIFFDLPNELKKWSDDPKLRNIINQLKLLNINEEVFKILDELRNIKSDIECMTEKKYIETKTKFKFLGIIAKHIVKLKKNNFNLMEYKNHYDKDYDEHYYQKINTNPEKTKSNNEIIKNLESLIKVIKNFRIRNHPLNY